MRHSLLTSAVVLGLALTAPAFAQTNGTENTVPPSPHRLMRQGEMNPATGARWGHHPGIGESLPFGVRASNITPQDTRSIIAPTLPTPRIENASTDHFLGIARHALFRHQTGLAQSALEQAMTARLNGDEVRGQPPQSDPTIGRIQSALDALAAHRYRGVDQRIAEAMQDSHMAMRGYTGAGMPNEGGGPAYSGAGEYGMNGSGMSGDYAPGSSNYSTRHNREDLSPVLQPPHPTMPGTLGAQVSPSGTQMNPTGNPAY